MYVYLLNAQYSIVFSQHFRRAFVLDTETGQVIKKVKILEE